MATAENPHAGQGSVLLDIGGSVGALVVTMPAELEGVEVEAHRRDDGSHPAHDHEGVGSPGRDHGAAPDHGAGHDHEAGHDHGAGHDHEAGHDHHRRPHVAVVARPVAAGGVVHSLVFAELVEGDYELYRRDGGPVELTVPITGGAVTEATWPWPAGVSAVSARREGW
jgi:hypothetical protein